jgi:DNA-binding CsgD family transcriptional regulator
LREIASEVEEISSDADLESRLRRLNVNVHLSNAVDGRVSDRYVEVARAYVAALEEAHRDLAVMMSVDLAAGLFGRGEYQEALRLTRAASTTYLDTGRDALASWAMATVPASLAELGRVGEAIDAMIELAELSIRIGRPTDISGALQAAIPVALSTGQPELAARLYGALVPGMVGRGAITLFKVDSDVIAGWLKRIEGAAPKLGVELAIREGARSDPVQVLKSLPDALRRPASIAASVGMLRHGTLTKREVEVLTLVGRGRSDPEIAEAQFISPKTASVHVSNIKGKLGLESRLEVALRARDLGLVEPDAPNPP